MKLGDLASKIRSKNAGPFWVSIDVFCEDEAAFTTLCTKLKIDAVATAVNVPPQSIKRFEIEHLNVIKFSFPRSAPQGSRFDRDMHGAQFSHLLAGLEIPD
ncbi:MAG: DUF4387 family protein [Rhodobacteraceae bacterium]|nr:DUF4387 family protein [Paracoccaceae bacterium]